MEEETNLQNKPKSQKKWIIFLIIAILLVLGALAYVYFFYIRAPASSSGYEANTPTVAITYNNFAQVMNSNPMVQAIPDDSSILLEFYNYNSGERQVEKSYILKNDGIEEGILGNPEVTLSLNSKYLDGLTNKNFCTMISQANTAGDLGFESALSTTEIAWKFKSMYTYKDCLGI